MRIVSSKRTYDVIHCSPEEIMVGFTPSDRVLVDGNVHRLWPNLSLSDPYIVTPGESSKCLETFGSINSWLAKSGATRNSRLFAIGGGVVGDLAGFVASSYMRGIEFVMVPTTLLAMVDSSVGGKTAIDIPEGKNLVGSFWPPSEVKIAVNFLSTLPNREFLCGCAEVWKYGFIEDLDLLAELESKPLDPSHELSNVINRCIATKAKVVQEDEEERSGRRAILNFGHTVGHAIESLQGYRDWNHGEAISAGMVIEAKLGELIGVTEPGISERVASGLRSQGLPTGLPEGMNPTDLLEFVARDKKSSSTGLGFSLLERMGECKLVTGVSSTELLRALNEK